MKKTICIAALSAAMTFAAANSFADALVLGPWADYEYYQHATTTYLTGSSNYPGQWVDENTAPLTFYFDLKTDPNDPVTNGNPVSGTNSVLTLAFDVSGYAKNTVKDAWATLVLFSNDLEWDGYNLGLTAYSNGTSYGIDYSVTPIGPNTPFKTISYQFSSELLSAWQDDPYGQIALTIVPALHFNQEGQVIDDFSDFTVVEVGIGATPVPEPATMLLFGTGLAGLAAVARRRKTQG